MEALKEYVYIICIFHLGKSELHEALQEPYSSKENLVRIIILYSISSEQTSSSTEPHSHSAKGKTLHVPPMPYTL